METIGKEQAKAGGYRPLTNIFYVEQPHEARLLEVTLHNNRHVDTVLVRVPTGVEIWHKRKSE